MLGRSHVLNIFFCKNSMMPYILLLQHAASQYSLCVATMINKDKKSIRYVQNIFCRIYDEEGLFFFLVNIFVCKSPRPGWGCLVSPLPTPNPPPLRLLLLTWNIMFFHCSRDVCVFILWISKGQNGNTHWSKAIQHFAYPSSGISLNSMQVKAETENCSFENFMLYQKFCSRWW